MSDLSEDCEEESVSCGLVVEVVLLMHKMELKRLDEEQGEESAIRRVDHRSEKGKGSGRTSMR